VYIATGAAIGLEGRRHPASRLKVGFSLRRYIASTASVSSVLTDAVDGGKKKTYIAAVTTLLKAHSTPATMSKQRSTLLPKTAAMSNEFIVKFRPFHKVETN